MVHLDLNEPIVNIVIRSLYVSGVASLLAFITAIVLCYYYSGRSRRSVDLIASIFEALVGVPTTIIGLLVYYLLYPNGPLGFMRLLYTPYAIIIGQFLVALPIAVVSLIRQFYNVRKSLRELILSLGLQSSRVEIVLVLRELTPILASTYLLAFSRCIGELGVAMIAGGAIEGYTSVLTTTIAVQTSMGNFEEALVLGLILISLTLLTAILIKSLSKILAGAFHYE